MDKQGICSCSSFREIPYCDIVQQIGSRLVIFRLVHIRIGSTVHYHFHVISLHHIRHCRSIGDVKFGDIGEDIVIMASSRYPAHFISKLAVGSGHKYIHTFIHL